MSAEAADKWDPPSLFRDVQRGRRSRWPPVTCDTFGSAGKAW